MTKYFLNNLILTELLDDNSVQASNSETAREASGNRVLKAIPRLSKPKRVTASGKR